MAKDSRKSTIPLKKSHLCDERPPSSCIALLLQGGGALGAYQAGVYQALAEADLHPDWVAGISIGAINAALIAGNPPEQRVEQLRGFWEQDHRRSGRSFGDAASGAARRAATMRARCSNQMQRRARRCRRRAGLLRAAHAAALAAAGRHAGGDQLLRHSSCCRATLERLVDFDRINAGAIRFSVGAVNVRTGNFVYFDNTHPHDRARARHGQRRAAAGLPGGGDRGRALLGRRPGLEHAAAMGARDEPRQDTLAFQVDLWNARGELPRDLAEVATRQKEIQYSSRTRASTDQFKHSRSCATPSPPARETAAGV